MHLRKALGLGKALGLWKTLGLASFAGVAATGVVIIRAERRRRAYTPDEIRDRLHDRLTDTPLTDTGLTDTGLTDTGLTDNQADR